MKRFFCFRIGLGFALCIAPGVQAIAGSFNTDFNSGAPGGATAYGSAFVDTSGGVGDSGVLKLTTATASQIGSFVIDDLDPGVRIAAFTASFKLRMGGGTSVPADGISFNYGFDLPKCRTSFARGRTSFRFKFPTRQRGQ